VGDHSTHGGFGRDGLGIVIGLQRRIRQTAAESVGQFIFQVQCSGIGLAVVDEITKALGGTADITSTLGQGTTVTITLPIYHAGQEHLHEPL